MYLTSPSNYLRNQDPRWELGNILKNMIKYHLITVKSPSLIKRVFISHVHNFFPSDSIYHIHHNLEYEPKIL